LLLGAAASGHSSGVAARVQGSIPAGRKLGGLGADAPTQTPRRDRICDY